MSDQTPPADLVQAKRDFLAAAAHEAHIARTLPSVFAEDGTVREINPEHRAALNTVRTEQQRLALLINALASLP